MIGADCKVSPVQIAIELLHGLYYCQQLFLGNTILSLSRIQCLTVVGNDSLSIILDLCEDSTCSIITGIGVYEEIPLGKWVSQNRSLSQFLFNVLKALSVSGVHSNCRPASISRCNGLAMSANDWTNFL